MNGKNTRRGFTLIELLVVVIIIAILAAIALPQYQKAVMKARITKIKTIMNTMDKAMELYALEGGDATSAVPLTALNLGVENLFDNCSSDTSCTVDNGTLFVASRVPGVATGWSYDLYTTEENLLGRFEIGAAHLITHPYAEYNGTYDYECRYFLSDNYKGKPVCDMLKEQYPAMRVMEAGS